MRNTLTRGLRLAAAARFQAMLTLAVAVTGCGGGSGGGDTPAVVPPAETLLGMPDPIPADAKSAGAWSALQDWPIIPIHVVLLPDGRVVNFGTDSTRNSYPYVNSTTSFNYDIWSPSLGFGDSSHLTLANTTGTPGQTSIDFFCAAQILLPEPTTSGSGPSVLIVGGDTYPRPDPYSLYAGGNPNSALIGNDNLVTKAADMSRGRWYASVTTLLNGDIYVQGGISTRHPSGVDHPELRSGGAFHLLTGITTGDPAKDPEGNDVNSYRFYYPRNFVAPDGRVFGYDTWGRMYYVDPYANGGAGSLTPLIPSASGTTFEGDYQGDTSTPAMFSPGRILQVGGYANRALVIDIRGGGSPLLTPTGSFSRRRQLATATLLPTGEVLITGGSEVWNELVNASKAAEIWSPVTGAWSLGPEQAIARLYHSTALLMPNGSVLTAGGGAPGPRIDPNDPDSPTISNFSAEVFFPSYLFKTAASGSELASRPTIGSVSEDPRVRRRFTLNYSGAPGGIARVTLVKTGATTHNFNMDQRFVELSFRAVAPGQLEVRMPSNPGDAPPGYYLLSVIDAAGHPSISKAVFVNTAPAAEPTADPNVTNPGDRVSAVGVAITAFSIGGGGGPGPVTFAAGKLPPGISMDASGRVGGTPSAIGSYDSVASVSDGQRTATANFVWTVN